MDAVVQNMVAVFAVVTQLAAAVCCVHPINIALAVVVHVAQNLRELRAALINHLRDLLIREIRISKEVAQIQITVITMQLVLVVVAM